MREGAEQQPDRIPVRSADSKRAEGDHRAEADAAECRAESRHPHRVGNFEKVGSGTTLWRDCCERCNE